MNGAKTTIAASTLHAALFAAMTVLTTFAYQSEVRIMSRQIKSGVIRSRLSDLA